MLRVESVSALNDNYIWIVSGDGDQSRVLVVDPGEAQPVNEWLNKHGATISALLLTHHHPDHTAAAVELAGTGRTPIYGPGAEGIRGVNHPLHGGEQITLDGFPGIDVIPVPGHTKGHVAYYVDGCLFSGDALFAGGCGRLFEGSAEQMHESLQRLATLPDSTLLYCGHEYTVKNLEFAHRVEPDNQQIAKRLEQMRALRGKSQPTLPSSLGEEKQSNPFLRTHEASVVESAERWAGGKLTTKTEVFATLRHWKDRG
ncbi:hydroxyacylglutathione hydrolase [Halorhodospira halochloris]|uniref:Hydroxyacylglutathione hydrolase n=1 Tax=Halorhodospira halochloris TaxID=1052 RepID=A0A110B1I6_HALHR|nr:hydroxyacylglutathione hydrolase [Halorhodospira halochloris]MBK1652861.1 hydroxyacylglutathione hydrolase [Halorhodospira halochloris]BAU57340.1 hydroxyacylglutathione hydrolase [Halorhodospira halochloris]